MKYDDHHTSTLCLHDKAIRSHTLNVDVSYIISLIPTSFCKNVSKIVNISNISIIKSYYRKTPIKVFNNRGYISDSGPLGIFRVLLVTPYKTPGHLLGIYGIYISLVFRAPVHILCMDMSIIK